MDNEEWGLLVLVYTGSWGLVGFRGKSWDGFVGSKQFGAVPGKALIKAVKSFGKSRKAVN